MIDDDGDEVQVEVPAPEALPLLIKIEHENISQDSEEPDGPVLIGTHGTGCRDIYSLLPQKGSITRPLGYRNQGEVQGVMLQDAPQDEMPILTGLTQESNSLLTDDLVETSTSTGMEQQSDSNLIGDEHLSENSRELE